MTRLTLVVLRSSDPARLAQFYERFGLSFRHQQRGQGEGHFEAVVSGCVFEIYPQGKKRPTTGVRLGFEVAELEPAIRDIEADGGVVVVAPRLHNHQLIAVVDDFDGHRIELTKARGKKPQAAASAAS